MYQITWIFNNHLKIIKSGPVHQLTYFVSYTDHIHIHYYFTHAHFSGFLSNI